MTREEQIKRTLEIIRDIASGLVKGCEDGDLVMADDCHQQLGVKMEELSILLPESEENPK